MAVFKSAWGIDVGNRALKAIKLVRDGEQIRIDDFEVIEHEQILSQAGDNRETLLQTALTNFAQKHNAKGSAVSIGVSGQSSFARFIKLPPVNPDKIPEIVKFEAIQQIPFPLEDVEWSYQLFQTPDSPEVEVGIFAMRRELVNQTIKNFTDVGLEVTTVQMNPLALYNGLYYDDRIKDTTMIIDVGSENSDLIIAEGENIWMRSIPIGGNNFTEALVKSFRLKFAKAEELKRNAATSKYGRQILQAMKPVFSDLVSEIQRSIGFYSSTHRDSRIAKVLALGGTFRLPGLQKYLQQNLQLEVARIDRLNTPAPADARFAAAFNENILSSIGAYGLALQAMGQAKIQSSLLPEKIRKERMWKEKTKWFAAAAALFVAGTGVVVGKLYADRYAYDAQKPARDQIASKASMAKNLDGEWKGIETSGADDRTLITNYMGLLADRDLSIEVTQEIGKAFPRPNAAEYQKPRASRQVVELVGWTMRYEPNLGPLILPTQRDDEFNQQADKTDLLAGTAGGSGGSGLPTYDRNMGGPLNPRMGRSMPGTPAAPAGDVPAQRGFLVTIVCRTPASDPTPLVADTVVKALRARNQDAANPPKGFSIERVTIPSKVRLSSAYPNGLARAKRTPLVFTPPSGDAAPVTGGGQFGLPPNDPSAFGMRPGLTGSRPGLGIRPGIAPGGFQGLVPNPNNTNGAATIAEIFADPIHPGETMENDSLVTVLAAIVIDPPPKPKPDAVAQAPG